MYNLTGLGKSLELAGIDKVFGKAGLLRVVIGSIQLTITQWFFVTYEAH